MFVYVTLGCVVLWAMFQVEAEYAALLLIGVFVTILLALVVNTLRPGRTVTQRCLSAGQFCVFAVGLGYVLEQHHSFIEMKSDSLSLEVFVFVRNSGEGIVPDKSWDQYVQSRIADVYRHGILFSVLASLALAVVARPILWLTRRGTCLADTSLANARIDAQNTSGNSDAVPPQGN